MSRWMPLPPLFAVTLATGLVACGPEGAGGAPPERAQRDGQEARVIAPPARPFGHTSGEWSALHWRWTYSLPKDQHPLTDTADCSAGQSGPVWFLGGWFAQNPDPAAVSVAVTRDRACTVPAGTALFFPVMDAEGSTAEGIGATEADLRAFARFVMDHAVGLRATIDGEAVADLGRFRAESPLFEFGPLPEGNLLGLPPGTTSPAVSDGVFLLLAPPAVGTHTVRFSGAIVFTQAQDGFDFSFALDITYHLTVAPGRGDDAGAP